MNAGRWHLNSIDIKALALAPLFPCVLLVLFDGLSRAATFGLPAVFGAILLGIYVAVVMELFALALGLPLLLLLKRHLHRIALCIGIGALMAALPVTLLAFGAPLPDSASSDGIPTVIDAVRTRQWYVETAGVIATCMGFGAMGGGAFWWLRKHLANERDENGG